MTRGDFEKNNRNGQRSRHLSVAERSPTTAPSWWGGVRRVFSAYFPRIWRDDSCLLDGCGCRASADWLDGYCSAYCAAAARDVDDGACACNHDQCVAAQHGDLHTADDEAKISIGG